MKYRDSIAAELRDLRQRSGLEQKTVAELAGISPSFLCLLEHGKRDVSLGKLGAIARACDAKLVIRFDRSRA